MAGAPPSSTEDPGSSSPSTRAPAGPAAASTGLPTDVHLPDGSARLRRATIEDVPAVVALLAKDHVASRREHAGDPGAMADYLRAFAAVDADPAHDLVVAVVGGEVVATLQVSYLPGLSRRGALRAQVEGVRVAPALRSGGLGAAMMDWVVDQARWRGCALVQLTTDASRTDAHRFYERLGFTASHRGFKLLL